MGIYLNPEMMNTKGNKFRDICWQNRIDCSYNRKLNTEHQNICVSRPRRFGKSMAANMLVAYYCKMLIPEIYLVDLRLQWWNIWKHLNKYNVIHINMIDFLSRADSVDDLIDYLQRRLLWDIKKEYSDVDCFDWNDLVDVLETVYSERNCHCYNHRWMGLYIQKYPDNVEEQKKYLDF